MRWLAVVTTTNSTNDNERGRQLQIVAVFPGTYGVKSVSRVSSKVLLTST